MGTHLVRPTKNSVPAGTEHFLPRQPFGHRGCEPWCRPHRNHESYDRGKAASLTLNSDPQVATTVANRAKTGKKNNHHSRRNCGKRGKLYLDLTRLLRPASGEERNVPGPCPNHAEIGAGQTGPPYTPDLPLRLPIRLWWRHRSLLLAGGRDDPLNSHVGDKVSVVLHVVADVEAQ
jgi:hypothetical protein